MTLALIDSTLDLVTVSLHVFAWLVHVKRQH